ncbi:hypothetical protein D4R52_02250 [bacterium]|nr:MAG: hypothetical protein D4R52_02250 [bacterium]
MSQQDLKLSFEGLTLEELGEKILEIFPNEQGAGLDLEISWFDEQRFIKQFRVDLRFGLHDAIDLAIKAKGWSTDTLYFCFTASVNPLDTRGGLPRTVQNIPRTAAEDSGDDLKTAAKNTPVQGQKPYGLFYLKSHLRLKPFGKLRTSRLEP